MSSKDLIEMATKSGYSVGRNTSGKYRYGKGGVEREFVGKWSEFCRFMKALCK